MYDGNGMKRYLLSIVTVLLLCPVGFSSELTDDTLEDLRSTILPNRTECRWQSIEWRATFWDAVVEANRADRPILLWAMNGHPLACT